ncbi:SDR family NAD(P)-dependent oxidoreductase [Vulcanisaeta thermophila]|uniref:SDR family NAD(P)-dependent oxidoreductase n=1 Tax=Vulcanisaeta thermophila TaxID=867917 RepID=UPI000853A721|nr:SDR family NAD(P)-dependent oxidoreductase [Vulcanisaeta thermophila]
MGRLDGKVVLVTGASRGIGGAIARAVALEGAHVIINYRQDVEGASRLKAELDKMGLSATLIKADVSSEDEVRDMMRRVREIYGSLDGLVNNAGHGSSVIWNKRFHELTWEDFMSVINVDLKGTFLCSKYALDLLRDGGSIVNVTSIPVKSGDTVGIPYLAAKASVYALTKSMALALAPRVRVNAVMLGSIETGWINWVSQEELRRIVGSIPMGRLGKPEEVARAVVFLLSDDSSFITGHVLVIDGGECLACD